MKKGTLVRILMAAVVVVFTNTSCIKTYNELVEAEESVTTEWANVESQYQRRLDLIPNLVSTVKGYAKHESATLTAVVDARTKATQITIDADNLTPEKLQAYQEAQGEVASALGRLMAITENYPDLKANQNFMNLQEQFEGTENRIQVARQKFNTTAQAYNTKVRRFPTSIIAWFFNFDKKSYFEADASAKNAPIVEF